VGLPCILLPRICFVPPTASRTTQNVPRGAGAAVVVLVTSVVCACAGRHLDAVPAAPPMQVKPLPVLAKSAVATEPAPPLAPIADIRSADEPAVGACSGGMQHIHFDYCPDLAHVCLDKEYDKPNHITICNRFAKEPPVCRAPRVTLDFCIDEYEYPNRAGAKPPVMLNFYEASGLCAAEHKRLCYESEWVTACEGPEEKPFPYGYVRSSEQCNFDNRWIDPHLDRVYSKDPNVQQAELARLDRSLPSGQKAGCVSDYGVHDLTGNVDEWALADHERPRERAKFSALKGGAWGHVRNACRPVTTSHVPEFRYYFIGFRCCSDAATATRSAPAH
jgi:formylglycine-generating enzyme